MPSFLLVPQECVAPLITSSLHDLVVLS